MTLAFAGAQEGVGLELETNAVVYSPRWKQMLGYADDEIEPHVNAWERLLHPDDKLRASQVNEESQARCADIRGRIPPAHTRMVITSTCCPAALPCAPETGRSCRPRSWALTSTDRAEEQAESERAATEFLGDGVCARKTSAGAFLAKCTTGSASS